jgi:hypothetical protein
MRRRYLGTSQDWFALPGSNPPLANLRCKIGGVFPNKFQSPSQNNLIVLIIFDIQIRPG